MAYKRLGDILLSVGMITEEQLNAALDVGKQEKKRLGEVLISTGVLTERQLIDVLKLQLGVEYIDLTKVNIPTSLASIVPKNLAKKHGVIPVQLIGDTLYLAMQDPLNFVAIEEIRSATKKRIVPMIAMADATNRAIATLYGNEGVSNAIADLQESMRSNAAAQGETVSVTMQDSADDDAQAAPAIRLVNSILERAAAENASDIHIEPRASGLIIRMRIDGVLHEILTVPQELQNSIISRIKIMSEMDISERRIPQDGRANLRLQSRDIDLRVSTLPTNYGEKIVIRFLEKSGNILKASSIGLQGQHLADFRSLIQNPNGVILISGPTGSGKSTTMYTMISELNTEFVNLVTLEDPIEYNIDGVNQVQINEKVGMTFASGLRSILRQDPDIIAVGEIRDGETAEIAMRAAITGHLVLSTIHTNSALATIDRLIDIGCEPFLIASALKGVIAQRLVRRICPHCRKEYTPTEEELAILHLDENPNKPTRFYRGTGCPDCLNTGFRGRIGVFEIAMITPEIKQILRRKGTSEEITDAAYRAGFAPMLEHCRQLVLNGVTSVSEAKRILHSTDI